MGRENVCTAEDRSALNKDKLESFARTWMHLENITLHEINWIHKLQQHRVSFTGETQNINIKEQNKKRWIIESRETDLWKKEEDQKMEGGEERRKRG